MSGNVTKKEKKFNAQLLESIIVILLGVTALLTAWASWIGSLHGGNQATNYTQSTNLASEGNSEYNDASQQIMQDMLLWNDIGSLQLDIMFAQDKGDSPSVEEAAYKLYYKICENANENFAAAIGWEDAYYEADDPVETVISWMEKDEAMTSPFTEEEFVEAYFDDALAILAESEEVLKKGQADNTNGDKMGLVTVIYSVVLFLLGIVNTFKSNRNQLIVVIVATIALVAATIFMLTVPMPTGFDLLGYFKG